jgi:hypothetical protein
MKENFIKILSDIIKPKLINYGFKASGNTFRRQECDFLIIFDIWKSQWNSKEDISFWFETGVFIESFYEFMFNEKPIKTLRTNQCSLRLQSGSILRKGVPGYEYRLTKTNFESLKNEINSDLDNDFLPLLEKLKKIEDILVFGELDPVFCDKTKLFVGFALAKKGEKKKAHILINDYLHAARYPQNWTDRINNEMRRLNIMID